MATTCLVWESTDASVGLPRAHERAEEESPVRRVVECRSVKAFAGDIDIERVHVLVFDQRFA